MRDDQALQVTFLLLALSLPIAALLTRRLAVRSTVRLALVWLAIILLVAAVIGIWRNRAADEPAPLPAGAMRQMVHVNASNILHNIYYRGKA